MKKTLLALLFPVFLLSGGAALAAEGEAEAEGIPYPEDITYDKTAQSVVFSHSMHVEGFGQDCAACHGEIFEPKTYSARIKGDFKMAAMYDGKYCGACHNGESAFAAGDYESCGRCHTGERPAIKGKKVKGPQDAITLGTGDMIAEFRHTSHEGFPCYVCHTKVFPMKLTKKELEQEPEKPAGKDNKKGKKEKAKPAKKIEYVTVTNMEEINEGKSCGSCHNGNTAFDQSNCNLCHPRM